MSDGLWEVPSSWKWTKVRDIAKVVGGSTPTASDPSNFDNEGTPWITPADLTGYDETYIERGRRSLSAKGLADCGATVMPAGTVLFSSRAPIGYCAIARNPISTNQGFKSLVLGENASSEFIRYYLLSAKSYAEGLASGTTFKELSGARMAGMAVPLPPVDEQHRIVAKLNSLFARSRAVREELARVPHLVERYKQAVLEDAFTGELTADWREANHISLSETWREESLGNVVLDVRYGTAAKCHYEPKATPVLRIPNIAGGTIDTTDLKYASFSPIEIKKLALKRGDLLVIRSNGSLNLVGRAALATPETIGYLFAGYLIRLRFNESQVDPSFAALALQEPTIRANVERLAKSTSGVNNINGEQLRGLRFQIPKVTEQNEIVTRVGEAHVRMDRLVAESTRAVGFLNRLDQAALAKAFRGELVL